MDEQFMLELIDDLDHMRLLLERCANKLRAQTHGGAAASMPSAAGRSGMPDIRAAIDRKRQEIMAQVEQAKAQALQAAQAHMPAIGAGLPMGAAFGPSPWDLRSRMAEQQDKAEKEGGK
jgi:hypothetical protein